MVGAIGSYFILNLGSPLAKVMEMTRYPFVCISNSDSIKKFNRDCT